ncbi:hypothetical protein COT51_00025 [candidate division WWE3 bacterium CG08_land_8_20_14_0_20_41_15]|uniref:Uncharacterized protein n=1 Tax=candidate division WWE3 bacterium CG08_land_8_20_14_0_20_41_15 TaxID=1975086 RepID=A0A2H0XAI4_UNCKA|nr:MAG: hypothetical protein COT51_00025 [candidate division WWE3 bacterium CG08_land_8_20_14_0_20_41_15]
MTYKPTLKDAAVDLRRAIYASFSKDGFQDEEAKMFLDNARKIIVQNPISNLDFEKAERDFQKESRNLERKREHLLMASIFLLDG